MRQKYFGVIPYIVMWIQKSFTNDYNSNKNKLKITNQAKSPIYIVLELLCKFQIERKPFCSDDYDRYKFTISHTRRKKRVKH